MKLVFLGTNGWYDTKQGNTLSVLLDTDKAYVVFDAGGGFYKLDTYIKENRTYPDINRREGGSFTRAEARNEDNGVVPALLRGRTTQPQAEEMTSLPTNNIRIGSKPIILLLSHFHLDHIIGLHALNKFNFPQGINAFGPKGIKKVFDVIINHPYSKSVNKLRTKIIIKEFLNTLKLPIDIKFKKLLHSSPCYGYRVSAEGKKIVFCTDTGPCLNLNLLAEGADILITESSLAPGQTDNNWPHLNPEQAASIAKASKVKKLVLAHFDAGVYLTNRDRLSAQNAARTIFRNTIAAKDGLSIKI